MTISESLNLDSEIPPCAQEAFNKTKQELEFYYDCENSYWKQRARISWHLEGERNTKYFHTIATKRRNNLVTNLKDDMGNWTTDLIEIASIAFRHFSSIFQASDGLTYTQIGEHLDQIFIQTLGPEKIDSLCYPPSFQEVESAVFSLPKDSAPGPDGFHASFYQKNWDLVSKDVFNMVSYMWEKVHLLKAMNKTNVVLIPKTRHPQSLKDFRPISLSNVSYKFFSKVLCNRLKNVLPTIIHPCQNAFLKGRLISDNVMLAADLMNQIHSSRGKRKKLAALKVDYSKAFDRLSWEFITALLHRMRFPEKFIRLIYQCLSSVEYHFLLNGMEIFHMDPNRGVRQGDSLSPLPLHPGIECSLYFNQ